MSSKFLSYLKQSWRQFYDLHMQQWEILDCSRTRRSAILFTSKEVLKCTMQQTLNSIRWQWLRVSKKGSCYNFLGLCETVKQDEKSAFAYAAKVYLQRMSVIWSSPLSNANCITATNQFTLPVLNYLMWTQHWLK